MDQSNHSGSHFGLLFFLCCIHDDDIMIEVAIVMDESHTRTQEGDLERLGEPLVRIFHSLDRKWWLKTVGCGSCCLMILFFF